MFRDLLDRLFFRLMDWLLKDSGNGEDELMRELDELDRDHPGWDDVSRSHSAEFLLRNGIPRDTVAECYGENPTKIAEAMLRWERDSHGH